MVFVPLEGQRYDMPAVFGPSAVPDRTVVDDANALVLSFSTLPEAAGAMLPRHFVLPETVTVSISYVGYRNVDYLGGQDYNEVVVSLSALHVHEDETIAAAFAPVLWVNKVGALVAGREYMGLGKLIGVIPDMTMYDSDASFTCYEDDTLLMKGGASSLKRLAPSAIERVNAKAGEVQTFGWKYIAAPGGGADLDYPLLNVMRWDYRDCWTGEGWIEFMKADRRTAPFSSAALSVLAALPVHGPIRAFRGVGSATIDRSATRRLGGTGRG
ncbi:acetoacetate decarboxylase family protein [Sphingobium mellinum]|uniref:acetoacetate decarboxylase family protein n=1 Tax=Sphingobium mellinum TaxID=1387166 RepID=UPI0030EB4B36